MSANKWRIQFLAIPRWNFYKFLVVAITCAALINLVFSGFGFVFWPDSIGYLGPLADWQAGRGFTSWYGRGFLYPAFLAVLIQDGDNYLRVLFAQMFLLGSVFVFAGWLVWRCGCFLDYLPAWRVLLAKGLLIFGLMSFDFNSAQLSLVHTAMPETLFAAFVALQCFLMWMTLHSTRVQGQFVGLAGVTFIGLFLILIKPHFLATALILPVILAMMLRRQLARRYLLLSILLGCIVSAPFHLFDQQLKAKYDPRTSKTFGPKTLFCNNLDVLEVAFQRGLDDKLMVRPEVREILKSGTNGWDTLGFDGDKCMYGELGRTLSSHFKGKLDAEVRYYYLTYISAVQVAPDMVLRRFTRQLKKVMTSALPSHYERTNDCQPLDSMTNRSILFKKVLAKCLEHDGYRIDFFAITPKVFNLLYVSLLCCGILWFGLRWMYFGSKGATKSASCFNVNVATLLAMFSYVLLVGLVHSFDIFRYLAIIAPLIFMSFCCVTTWLFSVGRDSLASSSAM